MNIPFVSIPLRGQTIVATPYSMRVTYSDGGSTSRKTGIKWSFEVVVERGAIGLYILGQGKPKLVISKELRIGGDLSDPYYVEKVLMEAIETTEKVEEMRKEYYAAVDNFVTQ